MCCNQLLTLSERDRHCRTCTVPRRTRRWPAGRSWWERGGAGARGEARHAAAASSPGDAPAGAPRGAAPASHLTAWALATATTTPRKHSRPGRGLSRARTAAAASVRPTVRETRIHFLMAPRAHAPRSRRRASRRGELPAACSSARLCC